MQKKMAAAVALLALVLILPNQKLLACESGGEVSQALKTNESVS